jgi:hypothetical protein
VEVMHLDAREIRLRKGHTAPENRHIPIFCTDMIHVAGSLRSGNFPPMGSCFSKRPSSMTIPAT